MKFSIMFKKLSLFSLAALALGMGIMMTSEASAHGGDDFRKEVRIRVEDDRDFDRHFDLDRDFEKRFEKRVEFRID